MEKLLTQQYPDQQSRSEKSKRKNMEWSLFKILAKKILHLDPNTLIDYCDIEIYNEDLKIKSAAQSRTAAKESTLRVATRRQNVLFSRLF